VPYRGKWWIKGRDLLANWGTRGLVGGTDALVGGGALAAAGGSHPRSRPREIWFVGTPVRCSSSIEESSEV